MAEPNTLDWFTEYQTILITRVQMLYTATLIQLALKHPHATEMAKSFAKPVARAFLDALRADGLEIPPEAWESYKKDLYHS